MSEENPDQPVQGPVIIPEPKPEAKTRGEIDPPCKKNKDLEPVLDTNLDDSKEPDLNASNDSQNGNLKQGTGVELPEADNDSKKENKETEPNKNTSNNDQPEDSQAQTSSAPREKCKYAEQCYRRNAEHKANYSHPGDPDYTIVDNRPECEYGTNCYRKNRQHKRLFKHTQKPKRIRKTVQNADMGTLSDLDDSEEEESTDESDYDPSFINDEELEDDNEMSDSDNEL